MTPEERARNLVYKPDWIFLSPEGVSIRIAAEIRAAVEEEREACARTAERTPLGEYGFCDDAGAAIRARGKC